MKKIIGSKIKTLRTNCDLNQEELSKYLNVTQASLSAYENGNKLPSLDTLIRIADYFQISLDWLCNRDASTQFYTGTDLIKFFLEIKELKYLDYSIDFTEMDINTPSCIDSVPVVQLTFDAKNLSSCDSITFNNMLFSKFMNEYKALEKKLENLEDNQLKENYMKMWLEQQLQYYSAYIIERKSDIELPKGKDSIQ